MPHTNAAAAPPPLPPVHHHAPAPHALGHPPPHRPHWPLWLGLAVLLLSLAAAVASGLQSLMLSRALSESRTVAEMAENIGKWASQYGGVHVRTQGVDTRFPGNFLTRSVYGNDPAVAPGTERANLQQMESYYWKNPALIQREVADVIAASGSRARYRMTARTVINANNAPNAFEQLAMDALMGDENVGKKEFWQVSGNELRYARAVVPQKSCLRCHDSQDKAPDFLKTSTQFTGGGGFGYREGKTAGVISVLVPLPSLGQALLDSAGPEFWGMLALAGVSSLGLIGWALASSRAAHAHAKGHAPGHPVAHPPAHAQAPARPQTHARPPHPPHS